MPKCFWLLKTFVISILSLVSLVACSTFSKKECLNMNWAQQGHQTAMNGETEGMGQTFYQKTCTQEWGVPVNETAFSAGYKDGIEQFCTPENAMDFAMRGGTYRKICPKAQEEKFLPQFKTGQLVYLSNRVQELESQVSSLKSELVWRDSRISDLESRLSSEQSICH